jgi:hypothetical protein
MQGIVFVEFMGMVDEEFGPLVSERVVERSDLSSGGEYEVDDAYDARELPRLLGTLAREVGRPPADLARAFGRRLFARFATMDRECVGSGDLYAFLEGLPQQVHGAIARRHPGSELPTIETHRLDDQRLEVLYRSSRHFADLAEGMLLGCVAHFGQPVKVERFPVTVPSGTGARFLLTRAG